MESQTIEIPIKKDDANYIMFYMIIFVFYLIYIIFLVQKEKTVEPYSSYKSCIKQGYNNDFCLRGPPDSCVNCDKELKDKFMPKQYFTFSS